jgi:hypothetical protein
LPLSRVARLAGSPAPAGYHRRLGWFSLPWAAPQSVSPPLPSQLDPARPPNPVPLLKVYRAYLAAARRCGLSDGASGYW